MKTLYCFLAFALFAAGCAPGKKDRSGSTPAADSPAPSQIDSPLSEVERSFLLEGDGETRDALVQRLFSLSAQRAVQNASGSDTLARLLDDSFEIRCETLCEIKPRK